MNVQEILTATLSKAEKARRLYDLGFTRHQVADMICGGNYGWAHNIYKKHFGLETISRSISNIFNKEFGVEIEAFGVDRNKLASRLNALGVPTQVQSYNHINCDAWKIVTDSSIRASSPFEIVSPILKGEEGLSYLQKVCTVLVDLGAKINKTCGLHIHFNASSLSISDWKNLFKNYINLEAEIDHMLPLSRRANNNTYCKSLMNNFSSKASAFTAIDRATTVNQLSQAISDNSRYYKLNAESYMRHGTVEFRQHSGTIEFDKIGNWVRICSAMIDKSKSGLANSLHQFLPDNLKTYIRQRTLKLRA